MFGLHKMFALRQFKQKYTHISENEVLSWKPVVEIEIGQMSYQFHFYIGLLFVLNYIPHFNFLGKCIDRRLLMIAQVHTVLCSIIT